MNQQETKRAENMNNGKTNYSADDSTDDSTVSHYNEITSWEDKDLNLKDKQIDKRDKLSEEEIVKIIQTLVKQRKESIVLFTKGGRDELADIEKNEINLLTNYLPQMISDEDIKNIVENVINEVSATSLSDMGKIMPEVMKRGRGLIDGKTAQKFVQELLG